MSRLSPFSTSLLQPPSPRCNFMKALPHEMNPSRLSGENFVQHNININIDQSKIYRSFDSISYQRGSIDQDDKLGLKCKTMYQKSRIPVSVNRFHSATKRPRNKQSRSSAKRLRIDRELSKRLTDVHICPLSTCQYYSGSHQSYDDTSDVPTSDSEDDDSHFANTPGVRLHLHRSIRDSLQQNSPMAGDDFIQQINRRRYCRELVLWKPIEMYLPRSLQTSKETCNEATSNKTFSVKSKRNIQEQASGRTEYDELDLTIEMGV